MQIINQYSAIWIGVILVIVAGFFLLRRRPKWQNYLVLGLVVVALFTAWSFLHPRQSSQQVSAAQVQANIGQGTPVLLEFQSPY